MALTQQSESAEVEPPVDGAADAPSAAKRGKQRSPRREQVVDYLREAITVGRLADGERLIEERIATRAEDEPRPRARGAAPARARGPRRLVPVPRRGRARRLRGGDPGGPDPDPPHARALQLHQGARADGRLRLRRAGEGGLVDGRGGARGELLRLVEADIRFHEFVLSRSGQPHTTQVWRSIAPRIRAYFFRYGLTADLYADRRRARPAARRQCRPATATRCSRRVERHITVRTPGP